MQIERFPVRHQRNVALDRNRPYGPGERAVLNEQALQTAKREISRWPNYRPTPLIPLPGLARRIGIGELLYKDEGQRFGLESFKALGGAYAVLCVLQEEIKAVTQHETSSADLIAGRHHEIANRVTVATATDGNHGRSVAWGAKMFGCRCIIYLHANVSKVREREIARFGAEIRRVAGDYDSSVRQCAADAKSKGWKLVADTSLGGDVHIPSLVMQGYTVMTEEILAAMVDLPSHVFVPGAVGGLAAAVVAPLWERFGSERPRVVVVEPIQADCISRSLAAGRPTAVNGDIETFMACLAAGEVSPAAWEVLGPSLDDAISIPDEAAMTCMRLLADGVDGDPRVVSGESGCAATAGLIATTFEPDVKAALGLDNTSRVVVLGSEGATDAVTYERVVGRSAQSVSSQAA